MSGTVTLCCGVSQAAVPYFALKVTTSACRRFERVSVSLPLYKVVSTQCFCCRRGYFDQRGLPMALTIPVTLRRCLSAMGRYAGRLPSKSAGQSRGGSDDMQQHRPGSMRGSSLTCLWAESSHHATQLSVLIKRTQVSTGPQCVRLFGDAL